MANTNTNVTANNKLMNDPKVRGFILSLFALEVEGISLILIVKYAMMASEMRGYHSALMLAATILVINFGLRIIAAAIRVRALLKMFGKKNQE